MEPITSPPDISVLVRAHGGVLTGMGREAVEHGLRGETELPLDLQAYPAPLRRKAACFVTLEKQGALRGCIGSYTPWRALITDVAHNAAAAAFQDRRFKPLEQAEWPHISLSVTVLGLSEPIEFKDETGLLEQLRPKRDGLFIEDQSHRALFLPQVWEKFAEPTEFLTRLKIKAGLPLNHWSDSFSAARFEAVSVKCEPDGRLSY